jgi:1,2-phenylacetyl-CoA epoxidase catalytic subunit
MKWGICDDRPTDAHLPAILEIADDCLILGHRLSEWCGHAPILEEELALANMGLDLLGQASALYAYAGTRGQGPQRGRLRLPAP